MCLIREVWRDIPEYPNYQVSNYGRIKSLNYKRSGKERILKSFDNNFGYMYVDLRKDNKQKKFTVHRLVALAFIPNDNPIEKTEINHLDENPSNNHVSNICWCNRYENINYGTRNERVSEKLKGKSLTEEHKQKLSEAQKGKKLSEETKQKIGEASKGRKHTNETKQKLSEAHKGKQLSEETKQKLSIPIIQLDLQNNFIREWQSATQASKELKINGSHICNCCRKKRNKCGGFIWRYKE